MEVEDEVVESQSRSRDFIVLRRYRGGEKVFRHVTIPFAGFYCSEVTMLKAKFIALVTIPFAGFYCSEEVNRWSRSGRYGHNPVRGILLF